MQNFCGNCFCESLNEQGVCTRCGFRGWKNKEKYPLALPAGSILNGRYIIGRVLGQGGFGITYTARDHQTGEIVAIKEFFPDSMVTRSNHTAVMPYTGERGENFAYGKDTFLLEAKTMAQFIGCPNIVRVYSYFEENGTGYFVMEYVDGQSFQSYLKEHYGRIPWEDALRILLPVMDALSLVHEKGIIHRDVAPDNICIAKDGTVKLLDFGAARYSLGNVSQSLDVVLRHGFAPKEQYKRRGRQGPYTDVYALGATLYYALTGVRPDDALERQDEDNMPLPSSLGANVTEAQENVILKAMAVQPEDRYQSMLEFRADLLDANMKTAGRRAWSQTTQKKETENTSEPKKAEARKKKNKKELAPEPKLPKWLIPAGVALVLVLGVLLGTGLGGGEKAKQEAYETNTPIVDVEHLEDRNEPTSRMPAEVSIQSGAVYVMANPREWQDDANAVKGYFWGQDTYKKRDVEVIRFISTLKDCPEGAWDVSEAGDRSVMAWMNNGTLTVAADGVIGANSNGGFLFSDFSRVKEIDFGSCFDTSNVQSMASMFRGCASLETLDLSCFDTSNVNNMNCMFYQCSALRELNVDTFNTSRVTNTAMMFNECAKLERLDLSHFDTGAVTSMNAMFGKCDRLGNVDLSGFDTSKVQDFSLMFFQCTALETVDLSGFDTTCATDLTWMFYECERLKNLDLSGFSISDDAELQDMFLGCDSLQTMKCGDEKVCIQCQKANKNTKLLSAGNQAVDVASGYPMADYSTDLSYTDKDGESYFWGQTRYQRSQVETVEFLCSKDGAASDAWDVSQERDGSVLAWLEGSDLKVAADGNIALNNNASGLFSCFVNLRIVDFGRCVDTSSVTDMSGMFARCETLADVDLSGFNTSNVTNMHQMFYSCSSLNSLDLSAFDTSKVTDMGLLLDSCTRLGALDISSFDTSKVTDMNRMFGYCSALRNLDVSHLDTSRVTNMNQMFTTCASLSSLDLSGFDTGKVTDMGKMFAYCWGLTELDLSGFNTSSVSNMGGMFQECNKLVSLDLSGFDTGSVKADRPLNQQKTDFLGTGTEFMFLGCGVLEKPKCSDSRILSVYENR